MAYRSSSSDRLMSVTTSSRLSHLVWEGRDGMGGGGVGVGVGVCAMRKGVGWADMCVT